MTSAAKKYISHERAVPIVDVPVFRHHDDKQFALTVLDPLTTDPCAPGSIEHAYLTLRANVYIDQTRMLDADARRADGTEWDADDARSTHFVVLENRSGRVAVIACMRLILKSRGDQGLPIEEFFRDAFAEPAKAGSIEVSRFIVRHARPRCAISAKIGLMRSGLAHAIRHDLDPIFAVVEAEFERDLKRLQLPISRIAESRMVAEYNDENVAVIFDREGLCARLGEEEVRAMSVRAGSFAYWGVLPESART